MRFQELLTFTAQLHFGPSVQMFGSGGTQPAPSRPLDRIVEDAVRLPTAPARTIAAWLAIHEPLSHLTPSLQEETLLTLWERLSVGGRVAFIAHLKAIGVSNLSDRQHVANLLSRDRREGRIWLPGEPLPAPPALPAAPPKVASAAAQVLAPVVKASSVLRRAAAAQIDSDEVMDLLRNRRPSAAVQLADSLVDSVGSWLLRARTLVAMGSLDSASRAYTRAIGSSEGGKLGKQALVERRQLDVLISHVDGVAASAHLFFPRSLRSGRATLDLSYP